MANMINVQGLTKVLMNGPVLSTEAPLIFLMTTIKKSKMNITLKDIFCT